MKKVTLPNAPKNSTVPISSAWICGNLVFTSGQTGRNPETKELGATIQEQAEQCCKNVGNVLKAAGTCYENVLKATCFLADMNDFQAFNEVYAKYFTGRPARSCVAVKTLPGGAMCEIETVACLNPDEE